MISESISQKGVTAVIGFLAVIVITVAFVGVFTATSVPLINQNAEIEHNTTMKTELQSMNQKILSDSQTQRVLLSSNIEYLILDRSPNLQMDVEEEQLIVDNHGDYNTDKVEFTQRYQYIDNQTITYSHSNLYSNEESISRPFIVSDNTIYLHVVDADLPDSEFDPELELRTTRSTDTVEFNDDGDSITLETDAPVSTFDTVENEPIVDTVSEGDSTINITFEHGTYELVIIETSMTT